MTMKEYAKSRGLRVSLIAQQMGVQRQMLSQYDGKTRAPRVDTMKRIANAMTDLGATTTLADLVRAFYGAE